MKYGRRCQDVSEKYLGLTDRDPLLALSSCKRMRDLDWKYVWCE